MFEKGFVTVKVTIFSPVFEKYNETLSLGSELANDYKAHFF